jgi:pyruvate dehydrogenase E1 component alpha subunit
VEGAAGELLAKIRKGDGPQFLHAITYRFKGHVSVDAAAYRDKREVARALENDPLKIAEGRLASATVKRILEEAQAEVARAVAAAEAAPWPAPGEAYEDVQDAGSGRWR